MNFAEIRFWLALGTGVALAAGVRRILSSGGVAGSLLDRWLLLGIGIGLLLCVGWVTTAIFIFVSSVTWVGTRALIRGQIPVKSGMILLAILQLAPLVWFKYSFFIAEDILGLRNDLWHGLIIPVGISFYTFQCMSFSWDTLSGHRENLKAMPQFLDFMNYAGFFPQIVAGPIERRMDLLPQMEKFRFSWDGQAIDSGSRWVIIGLFYKLGLGDNLALYTQTGLVTQSAWEVWLQNILFGLRIYFDFAGYSLMAMGVGRWFGIRLTNNFLSPYTSCSMTDFWRRWHVTLSQWFRDYVYLPTGGNRWTRGVIPLLLVFFISGIWHGAGWNFILWGLVHGGGVLMSRLSSRFPSPAILSWLITQWTVFFGWLFFYQTDMAVLSSNVETIFLARSYVGPHFSALLSTFSGGDGIVLVVLLMMTGMVLVLEWFGMKHSRDPYAILKKSGVLVTLVVVTVILAPAAKNNFIYFAF